MNGTPGFAVSSGHGRCLELGLGRGSVGGWATFTTAAVGAILHGGELLLLLVIEDGGDLALRVLADGLHFGVAVWLREGLVREESLHLLLAIDQQRLDLRLLIGGEAEFAGHPLELPVGVHMTGSAAGLTLIGLGWIGLALIRGWGRVLGKCGAGDTEREQAAEGEGEELIAHCGGSSDPLRNCQARCGPGQGSLIPDGSCGSGVSFREVDGEWRVGDEGGVKMSRKSKKRAVSFGSGETSRN
jgi:hypothetical protein